MAENLKASNKSGFEDNSPWAKRWRELKDSMPAPIPTTEEMEEARLRLLKKVTFSEPFNPDMVDYFTLQAAELLDDAHGLEVYTQTAISWNARISEVLAAEGLVRPTSE